jgi:hypothetical protein
VVQQRSTRLGPNPSAAGGYMPECGAWRAPFRVIRVIPMVLHAITPSESRLTVPLTIPCPLRFASQNGHGALPAIRTRIGSAQAASLTSATAVQQWCNSGATVMRSTRSGLGSKAHTHLTVAVWRSGRFSGGEQSEHQSAEPDPTPGPPPPHPPPFSLNPPLAHGLPPLPS